MGKTEMLSAGIIIDGDDTLWETMPFYTEAKREFFKEMAQLGFSLSEIERTFEATDEANVNELGFSKHRFPASMVDTYRIFCQRYSYRFEESIAKRLETIGYGVFSKRPLLLDHAEQVLPLLRSQYKLILATKGDQEVQRIKIEHSGLSTHFDAIYIVEQKTERELRNIIEENRLAVSRSWAIGNSLKSDINPALRVGLKAIWIPYYTWDYEEDIEPSSLNLYKLGSLQESLSILIGG